MSTIELKIKELQNIDGGTKKDYNNGHDLGVKLMDALKNAASYYIKQCFIY